MTNEAAKQRLLSEVAVLSGAATAAEKKRRDAITKRNTAALAAQAAGASYDELGEAASLTRVGVYKMLSKGTGGSLRQS